MSCHETQQLMHAWLDRELDPARSLELEAHLQHCPACQREAQSFEALRQSLADRGTRYAAPAALTRQVRSALRQVDRAEASPAPRFRNWFATWSLPRLAASLAVVGAVTLCAAVLLNRPSNETLWAQAVVSAEVRALMPNHLTDVASSDQHTVKPWFNGKLDYTPPVVDLVDQGFPLVGGRLDFLREQRMACLVYKRGNHFINLFVWPGEAGEQPDKSLTRQGYHVVHWRQAGMNCWAVSDMNLADVQEFARLFRAAFEPGEAPR